MKKLFFIVALSILTALPTFAQEDEGLFVASGAYAMFDYNISAAATSSSVFGNYNTSISNNIGSGIGAIVGYVLKNGIAFELDFDANKHTFKDGINLTSLESERSDFKVIALFQPSFGDKFSAFMPYVGAGPSLSYQVLTPSDPTLTSLSSLSVGAVVKAGLRVLVTVMLVDIGLEYDYTTTFHSPPAYSGTLRMNLGLGLMF